MGRRQCVIIPIFLFSQLFQANQSVKGMMPTTFSKTYHKEKILNSKQIHCGMAISTRPWLKNVQYFHLEFR